MSHRVFQKLKGGISPVEGIKLVLFSMYMRKQCLIILKISKYRLLQETIKSELYRGGCIDSLLILFIYHSIHLKNIHNNGVNIEP